MGREVVDPTQRRRSSRARVRWYGHAWRKGRALWREHAGGLALRLLLGHLGVGRKHVDAAQRTGTGRAHDSRDGFEIVTVRNATRRLLGHVTPRAARPIR